MDKKTPIIAWPVDRRVEPTNINPDGGDKMMVDVSCVLDHWPTLFLELAASRNSKPQKLEFAILDRVKKLIGKIMGQPKKKTTRRRTGNRRSHLMGKLAREVNRNSPVRVTRRTRRQLQRLATAPETKPAATKSVSKPAAKATGGNT